MSAKIVTTDGRSFVRVVFGATAGDERRRCAGAIVEALATHGIACTGLALNEGGCTFVVATTDVPALRAALAMLNVAVRVRNSCAQLSLSRLGARHALPDADALIASLAAQAVDIVHFTASERGFLLVVQRDRAGTVAETILRLCASRRSYAA
jgi:aspartokinase